MLIGYRNLHKLAVPRTSGQMMKEMMWFNSEITIKGKSLFERNMYSCGVKYVGDLIGSTGRVLTYERFRRKFSSCNTGFLRYFGIISSMPFAWKEAIRQDGSGMRAEDREKVICIKYRDKEIPLTEIKTKQIYSLVNKTTVTPTAFDRWEKDGLGQACCSKVMQMPYKCTKSTKLQTFQFQLVHRFIPTNKFLYVRRIANSPSCQHCGSDDTIIHYFFACQSVRAFWGDVFQFINRNTYPARYANEVRNILFGIVDAPPVVNLLILIAKHYLYLSKRSDRVGRMEAYLGYVKSVHAAEMKASVGCSKTAKKTESKWGAFVRELK